ncbi:major facilitator superfamily domain-containing protein [Zopfochytrium polystomum]|nr:major facilitator superfamily domain-containing protein [Zopfochytrium polystomum]
MHLIGLAPIDWPTFLRDLVRPLWTHVDFRLVFFSRFLFQLGIATVQQFLQYWIGDCVSITIPAPQAVSYALMPLLILSPIGAMCIPAKKRKIVVYIAAVLMITTCLLLETVTSFEMALVVSGIFGLGYGPFISTEFAMLMDVLPSEEEAAKDMALWHSALVLPQIVATPIAGWMLDTFQRVGRPTYQCLGYNVVFAVCIVYFVGGAIVTKRIKGVQ